MNKIIQAIKERRSIRKYKKEQIDDNELLAILEAATFAPSGHNDQPWHFLIIQNRRIIDDLSRRTRAIMSTKDDERIAEIGRNPDYHLFFHAPTVIIVSGKEDGMVSDSHLVPFADCCAAIENMLLAAHSLNVASCWIGFIRYLFQKEDICGELPIPSGYKPYYAVALGYSDMSSAPKAAPRKPQVVARVY